MTKISNQSGWSVLGIKPGIQMEEMESKLDRLVIPLQMWN